MVLKDIKGNYRSMVFILFFYISAKKTKKQKTLRVLKWMK